jgi:hypothetical protein
MKIMFKSMVRIFVLLSLLVYTLTIHASEYRVPKKPASVTVADINLDGYLDIVLGHEIDGIGGLVSILINDGFGKFTLIDSLITGAYETSIQTGYIDSNDKPDIVMLDYDTVSRSVTFGIIHDYGEFGFDSIALYPLYQQITIWNYSVNKLNNDTYDDIVFISHLSKLVGILYSDGVGRFSPPLIVNLGFHPSGLAVGKINDDDRNDIAVSGNGNVIKVFLTKPIGFDSISINVGPISLIDIKIEDINNDLKNEIIGVDGGIPGTRKRIMVYSKDPSGIFQLSYSKWIDEAMAKIFVADLNNDSFNDIIYNATLYYPNSNYEVFHTYILFNNKDGTFQDPVNYYTGICSHVSYAADLDGNGWKDIITLNYDFYNPPPDTCSIHILFNDGTGTFQEDPVTDVTDEKPIPTEFELFQNYPNPFNNSSVIKYSLPTSSKVIIKVFDIMGTEIETLINEEKPSGTYEITWNATNLPSGVYFYRIQSGNFIDTKKMILLR